MSAVEMTQKQERMIAAIKGLLAKTTDNGATIEEATTAAAKAQELAFKYNLDLAAIAAAKDEPSSITIGTTVVRFKYEDRWIKDLMWAIASGNFCRIVYFNGAKAVGVVGADHNIQVCEHLHTYLYREILRLGAKSFNEVGAAEGAVRSTWVNRFAKGAVTAIHIRLIEQRKRMEQADTTTTALVVNIQGAVEAYYGEQYGKLKNTTATRTKPDKAVAAGWQAGQTIALNPAVGSGGAASGAKALSA